MSGGDVRLPIRFASLGSGSAGNATLITYGDSGILVDCGFTAKQAVVRMEKLGFDVHKLCGILLTHEHSDHAKGVSVLYRQYNIPVFTSRGTLLAVPLTDTCNVVLVSAGISLAVGSFQVHPVTVPHDAREPLQFIVSCGQSRIGVLTDLGSIPYSVKVAFSGCDALLVEANHDIDMLRRGPYPKRLQRRVASAWGHLNNDQTSELLSAIDVSKLQHLVIGHISEKHNSVAHVESALMDVLSQIPNIVFAMQDTGFGWLSLDGR